MKDYSFKDKFRYWLDKQMSKGTTSIMILLALSVLFVLVFVSILALLFKLRDSIFPAFWDSLANTINTDMPSSEDGSIGYIILNTLTALVGLLFTSILIGVVSSAIEEKLSSLRKGDSMVLEKNHTVILGYNIGEHGLLNQIILATGKKRKRVVVICTDIEKPDLEEDLKNNVEIPDNIEVICRNGDITNTNDLRCCSIERSELVIINALNDNRRIKAILAVLCLKKEYPECKARIVACVTDEKHLLPRKKMKERNIIMMKTDDVMAKIIAHTSTEPGLSIAFKELLNFEHNEFYFEKEYKLMNKSFFEATTCLNKASIVGIRRDGKTILNPKKDMIIEINDDVILFEQQKGAYEIVEEDAKNVDEREITEIRQEIKGDVFVFGSNIMLDTILDELPDDVKNITIAPHEQIDIEEINRKHPSRKITLFKGDPEKKLNKIASESEHIIILADRNMDKEDADINSIMLVLKLMNLREIHDYIYNLTVELNMENTYNVAMQHDKIDYIVSSHIASLLLAQISENPDMVYILDELLSQKGNELFSKSILMFNLNLEHDYSYAGLKQIVLSYGYVLLGYSNNSEIILNPDSSSRVTFSEGDRLFVLGEK